MMEINAEGEMEIRVAKDGTIAITGAKVLTLLSDSGPEAEQEPAPEPRESRKRRRKRRKTAQKGTSGRRGRKPTSEKKPRKMREIQPAEPDPGLNVTAPPEPKRRRGRPPKDDDYSANVYRLELDMSLQEWCKNYMAEKKSKEEMLEALKRKAGLKKKLSNEEIENDLNDMLGMLGYEG